MKLRVRVCVYECLGVFVFVCVFACASCVYDNENGMSRNGFSLFLCWRFLLFLN